MTARRLAGDADPALARLWLMLALTFSTGIADSVGYLGLDRVFTGNMTGNVVILGMAVTGHGLPVLGPAVALVGFAAGAAIAGRVLRGSGDFWSGRVSGLLGSVGGVFGTIAILLALWPPHGPPARLSATAALAGAMGVQAAAARQLSVKDVTTVVVTSTLAGLASDAWIAGRTRQPWGRRLAAVAMICTGAVAGASLLHIAAWPGVLASALIALAVALVGDRVDRRARRVGLIPDAVARVPPHA
jgi:uncharacterized membrane protein YoaK (UPF0700 family)